MCSRVIKTYLEISRCHSADYVKDRILLKYVPRVQHDYFLSFNQPLFTGVVLPLSLFSYFMGGRSNAELFLRDDSKIIKSAGMKTFTNISLLSDCLFKMLS